ncbi:MAG: hypothetical protein ACM3PT_03330 [Deltaproteobacteria bacterium]
MRISVFLIIAVSLWLITSCSPKIAPKPAEEVKTEQKGNSDPVVNAQRATPCKMFSDYADPTEIMAEFTNYRNFLKINDYSQAYELWTKAFYRAPGGNGKIRYHFDDGIKIFRHFYENEPDTLKKKRWIDSIDQVYLIRLGCFAEEATVAGRRAFDYYYGFSNFKHPDTIYNLFRKAVEINKEKSDYFVINPFSKILIERFEAKKTDTAEAKLYANLLLDAIKYGSANCKGNECKSWDVIKDYAPYLLETFEQIEGFYSPEFYKEKYLAYYKKNGNDCDTVDLVYRKLVWGGCDMKDPTFADIIKDRNSRCYIAPPEPGPLTKAFEFYNNGKYQKAINSFEDFIDKTDDNEKKAKYSLLIAKIYYGDIRNFPLSRKYALKAAGYKSGWGDPYILIGKLYASSGPLCGPGTGWDSQIVTWPAIDKFEYAKKIDNKVATEANKLIRNYEKYMPDKEELHSRMIKEGQVFKVGCWINETTTIRAAKN